MSKTTAEVPADKLELYEKLVATIPGVTRKGVICYMKYHGA